MKTITVRGSESQNYEFIENDILRSVAQNISLIVSTKKGTVPQYREFGIPMTFIDRPIKVAKTLMIAEVTEGIELFEPRAEIVSITAEVIGEKCYPYVEVRLKDAV
ncbi:MAG: hypothetical protein IKJ91_00175 [Clostridia bacterium]|nr:hypothetical protein [Clostridia bacterium]